MPCFFSYSLRAALDFVCSSCSFYIMASILSILSVSPFTLSSIFSTSPMFSVKYVSAFSRLYTMYSFNSSSRFSAFSFRSFFKRYSSWVRERFSYDYFRLSVAVFVKSVLTKTSTCCPSFSTLIVFTTPVVSSYSASCFSSATSYSSSFGYSTSTNSF